MATWAIGDLQGCAAEFEALLAAIEFDPGQDRLWLLGDLVNRGPDSLAVMRRVMALQDRVHAVLGNHDLHFLCIWYGEHQPNAGDTFSDLLAAPDARDVAEWLRRLPFCHQDRRLGYSMAHAGIPPGWTVSRALQASRELTQVLRGPGHRAYFQRLYGNQPDHWREDLVGMARWRLLTNLFTRMRLIDASGRLNFSHKGTPATAGAGWEPWYRRLQPEQLEGGRLLFGHWAALDGETGRADVIALDTGCVWGRRLTALCLESGHRVSVAAMSP